MKLIKLTILVYAVLCLGQARGETFKITAYDNCKLCTGKDVNHPAYGITASGKRADRGFVACNWLPFGTKLKIDGKIYTVWDRGAKSLFGTKAKPIKHIDIWMSSHKAALQYGVKYMPVKIVKNIEK